MTGQNDVKRYDLICVGGGIMSTTLALMIKLVEPSIKIAIFEKLQDVALESSGAWNNAGTGHSAFCELNYTPYKEGKIDITKALKICHQFEQSRQFWSSLARLGLLKDPSVFVQAVPHYSWVRGEENVSFLEDRYNAMKEHPFFEKMAFTRDHAQMADWFPLIMKDRPADEVLGATKLEDGVEVNFGELTRQMTHILANNFDQHIHFEHEVLDVDPDEEIDWTVIVRDLKTGEKKYVDANHVFIGAGGGALPLLQKVEIDEKDGYGGFPVSGQWLVCKNPEVIEQHWAKVYSKADIGSPPMSVPHLDTRVIDGKRELLFGPFAGFSTKFLKEGSFMDLPFSIKFDNIPSMWGAFWHNLPLTRYLINQVTMSHEDRMNELRKFVVNAKSNEWELLQAGQRVQIIKRDEAEGGILQFGTEVVSSQNGSITALLGASPGASTAVHVMIEVFQKAFPEILASDEGLKKMNEIIPAWNDTKDQTTEEIKAQRAYTAKLLNLASPSS